MGLIFSKCCITCHGEHEEVQSMTAKVKKLNSFSLSSNCANTLTFELNKILTKFAFSFLHTAGIIEPSLGGWRDLA